MHVPSALATREQWVVWKTIVKKGRPTKVPHSPFNLNWAKSNDSSTWSSLATAFSVCRSKGFEGIGFVFKPGDDLVGIDLDGCLDRNRLLLPWAARIVNAFPSYAEISPSRTGVKIFAGGSHQTTGCKLLMGDVAEGRKRPAIEVYGVGRYFCFTGLHWASSPTEVVDCSEPLKILVEWIERRKHAASTSTRPSPATPPHTSSGSVNWLEHRALKYIDRTPPTSCGSASCHDRTFRVAYVLVRMIGLSIDQARPFLKTWAERGSHKWTDDELEHKLTDAANVNTSNT